MVLTKSNMDCLLALDCIFFAFAPLGNLIAYSAQTDGLTMRRSRVRVRVICNGKKNWAVENVDPVFGSGAKPSPANLKKMYR